MLVHAVSTLVGATSMLLFVIGFFVPRIGILNAVVFLITGVILDKYFKHCNPSGGVVCQ